MFVNAILFPKLTSASDSVSAVAGFAVTVEASRGVLALCVLIAIVRVLDTFVDVYALVYSVASESLVALTSETTVGIGTLGVGVAVVSSPSTFVYV